MISMGTPVHRYFILNKPFNMVSQFVSSDDVVLLGDINFPFPEGTHAIGRLDNNSEGMLLLTTNKTITKKLFQGGVAHKRKYLVQVRHIVATEAIEKLRNGVSIQIKGGGYYTTIPCDVELVDNPYKFIQHAHDAFKYEPTSWLMMTLVEGKYHQVRKMVNAVGHKCKRLIRVAIENLTLGNLKPGEVQEIDEDEFFKLLKLER
jgi:23S rRNA pseudouridine2457 synthase